MANGYWVVRADGTVSGFGSASLGDLSKVQLSTPIAAAAALHRWSEVIGWWPPAGVCLLLAQAQFDGSPGGAHLNKPIVGMATTPDGGGYWLVASDGGIFAYGDAVFYGSTGGDQLNKPIVAMAATPDGRGYWLVASDGGIFAYGDAVFYGSAGGSPSDGPDSGDRRYPGWARVLVGRFGRQHLCLWGCNVLWVPVCGEPTGADCRHSPDARRQGLLVGRTKWLRFQLWGCRQPEADRYPGVHICARWWPSSCR